MFKKESSIKCKCAWESKLFDYFIDSVKFIVFLVYFRTEPGQMMRQKWRKKSFVLVKTDHRSGLPPMPHKLQLLLEEVVRAAIVLWATCFTIYVLLTSLLVPHLLWSQHHYQLCSHQNISTKCYTCWYYQVRNFINILKQLIGRLLKKMWK